jgi:hypothetical protein
MLPSDLPGADLVDQGLRDLRAGEESAELPLLPLAAPPVTRRPCAKTN